MALTKRYRINGAKLGMVTTAAFGNVVVKPGDVKHLQFWQTVDQARRERKVIEGVRATEPDHIPDHSHGVGVDGVYVEKVVLHLPDDVAELR